MKIVNLRNLRNIILLNKRDSSKMISISIISITTPFVNYYSLFVFIKVRFDSLTYLL